MLTLCVLNPRFGRTIVSSPGPCHSPLLQPHRDTVGGSAGVHHRQANETGAVGLKEHGTPSTLRWQWHAIHHDSERRAAADYFERHQIGLVAGGEFQIRAIRRKHDPRRPGRFAWTIAAKALKRRR